MQFVLPCNLTFPQMVMNLINGAKYGPQNRLFTNIITSASTGFPANYVSLQQLLQLNKMTGSAQQGVH